jgi:tRNA(Ser,Leu) C12 N-acetylase TAN1
LLLDPTVGRKVEHRGALSLAVALDARSSFPVHHAIRRKHIVMEWNVVVSVYQDGFRRAIHALRQLGPVERSRYHNILLMNVDNPLDVLGTIERKSDEIPALYDAIARIAPATRTFEFRSADEFREKAQSILREWSPQLIGRSFHVRLHRRGDRRRLPTPDIEKFLDDVILSLTSEGGKPAHISFTDPDVVISVDTVDDRAGLAMWTHDELAVHRLLRPD